MAAKLFCKTGELAGSEFVIDRDATIGSAPSNTIVLPVRTISREHARIGVDEQGRYVLTDLRSSNGTQIDKRPVRGSEPLGDLHVITFASSHDFVFQVSAADEASSREKTQATNRQPVGGRTQGVVASQRPPERAEIVSPATRLQPAAGLVVPAEIGAAHSPGADPPAVPQTELKASAHLAVPSGIGMAPPTDPQGAPGPGQVPAEIGMLPGSEEDSIPTAPRPVPRIDDAPAEPRYWHLEIHDRSTGAMLSRRLTEGEYKFGRGAGCELRIDNKTLSRAHALLTVRGERLTILDMGSANGTRVDGVLIGGAVEARDGMTLSFGDVTAKLVLKPKTESSD